MIYNKHDHNIKFQHLSNYILLFTLTQLIIY
jgi:hypothetical protein